MRTPILAVALIALASLTAGAQAGHEMHAMPADSAHAMKTPCPLHLTTLALTPAQTRTVDSLRADHETLMKGMMPAHPAGAAMQHHAMSPAETAAMESNMRLTTAAIRSVLDDAQRRTFDAAVTAHAAEMAAMKAAGTDACAECCKGCMEHMTNGMPMKHEG